MEQERKSQAYSCGKYRETFLTIYRDERLEAYYYSFMQEFLREFCTQGRKVVRVHDNRYRSEEGSKLHQRDVYAEKNGVPDLIVVSKEYSYEKTSAPYVSVEIKRPDVDIEFKENQGYEITRYNEIKWETEDGNLDSQLETEFRKTDYIIYTDCITWHFLKKTEADKKTSIQADPKCLLKQMGNVWEWAAEDEWRELKRTICDFMENSSMKKQRSGKNHAAET